MKKRGISILMLGPDPSAHGGIASVIATYRQANLIDGDKVRFVPTFKMGAARQKIYVAIRALFTTSALLCTNQVALLHIHAAQKTSFYRKSLFVLLARLFQVPVALHLHSGEFERFYEEHRSEVMRWYVRFVLRRASALIALSSLRAQWLQRIVPNSTISVIYNPFLMEDTESTVASSARDRVVVFMGRLEIKKGVYDLLQALSALQAAGIEFKALICGSGDVHSVNDFVARNQLKSNVVMKGWVTGSEKKEILESAAVLVLPSYYEGQPMAVLEAMAHRATVIASRVGGIPDIIEHGKDGVLIEPGDVSGLADGIKRLLEHPGLRDQLTKSAYTKVKIEFSAAKSIDSLQNLYQRLTERG